MEQHKDDPVDMSSTSAQTSADRPQRDRPSSPVLSCVSMKSEESIGNPPQFGKEPSPSHLKPKRHRPSSPVPSCVSMKSEESIGNPPQFCKETAPSYLKLRQNKQPPLQRPMDDEHPDMAESSRHLQAEQALVRGKNSGKMEKIIKRHKTSLKKRFENISEGVNPGIQTPLNEIYTELYITEGESEGVNKEHEVWQVESASRVQTTEDTPINCNDIFKPLPGQQKHIRTVMTKGVAGIGKTVLVQKFILDWVNGLANQNVDFMFPLSFRELNLVKDGQYSLHNLLLDFHPELKDLSDGEEYKDCRIVFIFDGLDESRFPLNFQQDTMSYVKQTSSVDVLMTSLIQGHMFPSALIWITSRPAAACQIPAQYINQVTEVRGFTDPQKDEYFKKKISDGNQANRIISHIKASRSLHIMCHIPVFCWITATVLQQMLEQDNNQEIPKTLTEMFIHFLLIQTLRKDQKYQSGTQIKQEQLQESHSATLKLAKLAFKNLENGHVMFYEDDLKKCGIDVSEASVYSGMCTEIFKEETVFQQRKIYCFVHLSIQEFLAALHVFVCCTYQMENLGTLFYLEELLKLVVNKVLENKTGHLDLLLRFLMGISLESNQRLLQGLLVQMYSSSDSIKKICQYIKDLNKENLSPERCISLLQCLSEVNDNSIHEEIQEFLKSHNRFKQKLSPTHCSVMAHMLLMSEEVLDEFDLKEYNTSDEGRRRLLPVARCCRKAHRLDRCKLNKFSCETMKRCLQSTNSLILLDLTRNALEDSGIQILSAGLTSPQCKLQFLRLADCKITDKSCEIVATVLQSPNSLIELDLSHNDLGDSGVQLVSEGLSSPHCKLETLRLAACHITEEGCVCMDSALTSNPSHLKELDLSYNHPGESGLKLLSTRQQNPICKLEILNVDHCEEIRLRPGVQKYACELSLDPNTAQGDLFLSEGNRKVTRLTEEQSYPDHPERFGWWAQVLCRDGLSGRCYWEAEWSGHEALMAMAYKSIDRKARSEEGRLGFNAKSWSLICSPEKYSVWHNNKNFDIPAPSSGARRVGVYLDWPAGTLSFYSVSSDKLTHLHTFHSTFTEPLYPGFWIWEANASMSLCRMT